MAVPLTVTRSELLRTCINIQESFDPKRTTLDAHVEEELTKDKRLGDVERKFIHQVFYGCARYQKFLRVFVTSFLYRSQSLAIRGEQPLYCILCYLLFFRLEELGVVEFQAFLMCGLGTASALLSLLQYALSVEDINRWVKHEWCKIYDMKYIEEDVIGKLQSFAEDLQPALNAIALRATGHIERSTLDVTSQDRKTTQFELFKLTQPRPRLIPEPEEISRQIKALPVMAAVHETDLSRVEEEKRRRLEEEKVKVAAKYRPEQEFTLTTAERMSGGDKEELAKKVEAERMAECTFQPTVKSYVPPTEEAAVRHNTAAVLREDALLRKKQAQEHEMLKKYEFELRDASEFNKWQQHVLEHDQREEEERVHQRVVGAHVAREEAIEAREGVVRKRQILAQFQREVAKEQIATQEQESAAELHKNQQMVQEAIVDRENVRRAEEEVQKCRAKQAEDVRKIKEAEFERKRCEDEKEMEKKKDLIRQIRAMERAPADRGKIFDPTEQPGLGLLEEMSLAELRERLMVEQDKRLREVEDKREKQLEKKLEKQQELAEKADQLARIRATAKEQGQQRRDNRNQKLREEEEKRQKYREAKVEEAAEKIAAKKQAKLAEEACLKRELKEISIKRQFLQANVEMVEAKAFGEQQAGLEREARDRQNNLLMQQKKRNDIKAGETMLRYANKQRAQEEYKAMTDAVTDRLQKAQTDNRYLMDTIKKANKSAIAEQRQNEQRLADEFGHTRNRYMQRVARVTKV